MVVFHQFYKVDNFCNSLLAFLHTKAFMVRKVSSRNSDQQSSKKQAVLNEFRAHFM